MKSKWSRGPKWGMGRKERELENGGYADHNGRGPNLIGSAFVVEWKLKSAFAWGRNQKDNPTTPK